MNENNDYRPENEGYSNPDNLYHYNYRSQEDQGRHETPVVPKKPSFWHKTGVKITALLLACAVVGGAAGYGGAALSKSGKTTIQQSNRTAQEVTVKKVTGQALMSPAEVYASTVNSIVSINCSAVSTNIFGQRVESASSGSGFVITQDGYIVTNHHVISGASSVTVTMYNGTEYPATVVGSDSDYDVAVLKIDATGLQPVTLGSSEDVNVGDTVLAIGNPLGELTFSMSQGIVSCCDRAINVDGTPFNMIQVDASINPGNSGGPLMNLYGEVTGKAYMAIKAGTMTEQMAAQYNIGITEGVFVYSTESGGAGERAGLQLGDVITKVNDTAITSMTDLSAAKKNFKAGDTVTLTVYRNGEYITLDLTFDEQPQTTGEDTATDSQQDNQQQGGQDYSDMFRDFYNYYFGRNGR